jgi:ferritin
MLNKKIEKAYNDQINAEFFSAYLYLSMASYFEDKNFAGFAHWMRLQAQEETEHALKFIGYIQTRGGRVVLESIDKPAHEWDSPLTAFSEAYEHEQYITGRINNLVKLSGELNDYASGQFLLWYVEEQVEEEEAASEIRDKLELVGNSPQGILFLDKELSGRVRGAAEKE